MQLCIIVCHHSYYNRYLSRVVLIPFMSDAPDIVADILSDLLSNAHAAIPTALKIGRKLGKVDRNRIESISSEIDDLLKEYKKDNRLSTQYAVSIFCAQQVLIFYLVREIGTSRNDINKPLDLDYSLQFLTCKFVIT